VYYVHSTTVYVYPLIPLAFSLQAAHPESGVADRDLSIILVVELEYHGYTEYSSFLPRKYEDWHTQGTSTCT